MILQDSKDTTSTLNKLLSIMQQMRSENGCAWNRKQTAQSLKPYLIEEAFELLEALDEADDEHLKEELGDVLYQVIFHTEITKEQGRFDIEDVMNSLCEKLIKRHPHVFTLPQNLGLEEIRAQWLDIKKKQVSKQRFIDVAKGKHPLAKSIKLQEEAAKIGFDWPDTSWIYDKVREELDEVKEACEFKSLDDVEDEMGDLFFAVTSLSRALKIDPILALERANQKFAARFDIVLSQLENHPPIETLNEWMQLWKNAKERVTSTKPISS